MKSTFISLCLLFEEYHVCLVFSFIIQHVLMILYVAVEKHAVHDYILFLLFCQRPPDICCFAACGRGRKFSDELVKKKFDNSFRVSHFIESLVHLYNNLS